MTIRTGVDGGITYGGFIRGNIRVWLLRQAVASGDPDNWLLAVHQELDSIMVNPEDALRELEEYERKKGES